MFCRVCGGEVRDGSTFCPKCGNPMNQKEQEMNNISDPFGQSLESPSGQAANLDSNDEIILLDDDEDVSQNTVKAPGSRRIRRRTIEKTEDKVTREREESASSEEDVPNQDSKKPILIVCSITAILVLFLGAALLILKPWQRQDDTGNVAEEKTEESTLAILEEESESTEEVLTVEEQFKQYLTTELIEKNHLYDSYQEGAVSKSEGDQNNDWMIAEGIMGAHILDLDKDGQEEMLVTSARELQDESLEERSKAIYLSVYEWDGEKVQLSDEEEWTPCIEGIEEYAFDAKIPTAISMSNYMGSLAEISLVEKEDSSYQIFNGYKKSVDTEDKKYTYQYYWTMSYTGNELIYTSQYATQSGGKKKVVFGEYYFTDQEKPEYTSLTFKISENEAFADSMDTYFANYGIEIEKANLSIPTHAQDQSFLKESQKNILVTRHFVEYKGISDEDGTYVATATLKDGYGLQTSDQEKVNK